MDKQSNVLMQVSVLLKSQDIRWKDDFLLSTKEHSQIMNYLLEENGPNCMMLTADGWKTSAHDLEALVRHLESLGAVMPSEPVTEAIPSEVRENAKSSLAIHDKTPLKISGSVCHRLVASEAFLERPGDKNARDKQHEEILNKLREKPDVYLPKASARHVKNMATLRRDFPNFTEVIQHVEEHLNLLIVEREVVNLEPLLLIGPPGVGKTEFARRLAEALRLSFSSEDLATCTGSFVLTGSSSAWASGQQGAVSKAAMNLKPGYGALLLLDELDKAAGDAKFPVAPALLNILEPNTAERFIDEYLGVPLNICRVISIIATGNDLSCVDSPLKSRLRVFNVPAPDAEQMRAIVRSLDKSLRKKRPGLNRYFAPLTEDSVAMMVAVPPRTMRQVLLGAYAMAAARKERALMRYHLEEAVRHRAEPKKVPMGFA